MKNLRSRFILIVALVMPLVSIAHEGHGHEHPWSPGHFLANPEHSIPLTLSIALVTVFAVKRYFFTKKERKKQIDASQYA